MTAISLFWFCAGALFYIYAGYPLLAILRARLFPRPVKKGLFAGTVSVVVVVHNEAAHLPRKMESILASEGQDRILEIIVASDGSTDGTEAALRAFPDPRLKVASFPARRGKPSVLNDVLPTCRGEVVVLTDARQPLHRQAIGRLLENFADDTVGVVSGELEFVELDQASAAGQGVGLYWAYEKLIRKSESRWGSVPGATGALYAIRRRWICPLPPAALLDDVVLPMQAVARGVRCLLEEGAFVYDAPSGSPRQEAIRKRRTIAGNIQLLFLFPKWIVPGGHPAWFSFASHKIARLFSPFLLLTLFVCNVLISNTMCYRALLAAQVLFYGTALAGALVQRAGARHRWLGAPLMFAQLNLATVQAWWDAARGHFRVQWEKATGG
jgi:biofilm PGA synthesis N-glycosyltransferase PgaC